MYDLLREKFSEILDGAEFRHNNDYNFIVVEIAPNQRTKCYFSSIRFSYEVAFRFLDEK